jgi:hypothetical protein
LDLNIRNGSEDFADKGCEGTFQPLAGAITIDEGALLVQFVQFANLLLRQKLS